jgi:inward rectifier potassium channel
VTEATRIAEKRPRAYSAVAAVARERPGKRIAIVKGQDTSRWTDFYHGILTAQWSLFFVGLAGVFVTVNSLFALAYMADPGGLANARPGVFWDAFLFSVQTLCSINYGVITPKSGYVNSVVMVQAFVGIIYMGLVISLMYARFSRPTARMVFSSVALITPFDGVPTLMFRAANQRGNSVIDAEARVTLASRQVTKEGIVMRRFEELKLERQRSSLFALSWTVMHRIDETSPLYGLTPDMLIEREIEVVALLSGIDEALADRIYARHAYAPDEIRWDHRFVDVLSLTPRGMRLVDLTRFHDTYAVEPTDGPG